MKRLIILSGLFMTLIIVGNLMAVKTIDIGSFTLPSAVICYPFCFAVGDIINEYFGFKTVRFVIIITFILNAVAIAFLSISTVMPPSAYFSINEGYKNVFLSTPRILLASFLAFLVSSILDSYIFTRFKKKGSLLLVRSAVSSLCGIIIDSAIFIIAAFSFTMPFSAVLMTVLGQILAKLIFGVGIGTPATMLLIKYLPPLNKKDREIFTPAEINPDESLCTESTQI